MKVKTQDVAAPRLLDPGIAGNAALALPVDNDVCADRNSGRARVAGS
jgi:hypothetical protein